MSTRRSFLVSGCLIAALALFGVAEAQAQGTVGKASFPKTADGNPVTFYVTESGTVDIPLEVMVSHMGENPPTAETIMISIVGGFDRLETSHVAGMGTEEDSAFSFYGPGFNVNDAAGTIALTVNEGDRRAILTGASIQDRNGDNEVATLRIMTADDAADSDLITGGQRLAHVVIIDDERATVQFSKDMLEVLEGTKATVTLNGDLGPEFEVNDHSSTLKVDEMGGGRDRMIQLLPGTTTGVGYSYDADGRLVINLSAVSNRTSYNFNVEVLEDPDGSNDEVVLVLSSAGAGIQLGDMTEMTLEIVDDDEDAPKREDDEDDEDGDTTPTPALPLFGAIALAGALATAGRRRMRQLRAVRERKLLV